MKFLLLSLFVSVVLLSSCKQEEPADVIYYNAELWTGDSAMPHVHAIAVKGNMIIYAGDDYKSYKGSNTRMEDVKGKMIVQGFIDNHTHYSKVGVFHSPCAVAAPTIFILRSSFVVGNIIIHMLSHNH